MTARIGLPLASGLLASLLFLTLARGMANGPLIGFLAPLPLMMAGLGLGRMAALFAAAIGTVAVAVVQERAYGLSFLLMAALPALVVANRALSWRVSPAGEKEWCPAGRVLSWLTLAGIALFAVAAALLSHHADGVRGWVAAAIGDMLDAVGDPLPAAERETAAHMLTKVLPALVVTVWVVMAAINAVLAQAILVRLGHARRPSPVYRDLDLPWWAAAVLAAALVAALAGTGSVGYVAANMAAVAALPFAALGIATAHRHLASRPDGHLGLVVLYGVLVLAFVWALIPAAGLGLVRFTQTRFRRRASGGGKEE
ncbi:MAG: DUF2232 domain-containing protein [Magnetospirillum sp.]|nr:DUF2232 domain-containing protein [Magnetospirillum sp.]